MNLSPFVDKLDHWEQPKLALDSLDSLNKGNKLDLKVKFPKMGNRH